MRNASALSRFVAMMVAAGVVLGGCGQYLFFICAGRGFFRRVPLTASRAVGTPLSGGGAGAAVGAECRSRPGPRRRRASGPRHRPRRSAERLDLPQSCQRPQRDHRQGHQQCRRADWRLAIGTFLRLAQARSGRCWVQSLLLWPGRHRFRGVQRQDRQLHRRASARRLETPVRHSSPRGDRRRRERCRTRRLRRADRLQRGTADRQHPAALPRGPDTHGRHTRARRPLRRRTPERGGRAFGAGGGPARAAVRQRRRLAHPVQPDGLDGGPGPPEPAGPRGPGRRFRPAAAVMGFDYADPAMLAGLSR